MVSAVQDAGFADSIVGGEEAVKVDPIHVEKQPLPSCRITYQNNWTKLFCVRQWSCRGQEVPGGVSESVILFHWSCLTTFVQGSPPRNDFNYVKIGGVLMSSEWSCEGQEVPDGGLIT